MHARVLICVTLSFAAVVVSCGKKEFASAHRAGPGAAGIALTDDELASYLTWSREYIALANSHKAELDAVAERGAARLPFGDPGKIAQDPELLAALDRQRTAMQAQLDRMPLKGAKAQALGETLAGIGAFVAQPDGLVYTARRDEQALANARRKYGDEYVQWVLSRESTIVATLGK